MHPFPVLCSSVLVAETGAIDFDAHFRTGVKLSWTCWSKQAGQQVLKVEGKLHLTGIIRIPMETACRHELTMLFYSEKWLCDNRTLLKIYSLFDFRYNFSFGEKALPFLYVKTEQMLPRLADEHTRINLTVQTINCRNSLQLFVTVHRGCNCAKIWHKAECRKC